MRPKKPSCWGVKFLTPDLRSPLAGCHEFTKDGRRGTLIGVGTPIRYATGKWVEVPGNGSYVCMTTTGLLEQFRALQRNGIEPATLKLMYVECREEEKEPYDPWGGGLQRLPQGIQCFHYVRVVAGHQWRMGEWRRKNE